jgi:hypothetical protein
MVVIDESLKKGRDSMSDRGVARKGVRALGRVSGILTAERVSVITSLAIDGVHSNTCINTNEMSVDTTLFMSILRNIVLPKMNAYPAPCSVLVLDNARIHNRALIYAACNAVGVIPLFLPAYSCDFSPIELLFGNAKNYMKRTYGRGNHGLSLAEMFTTSIYNCLTPDQICNCFEHCHIPVTPEERAAVV